MTRKNLLPVAPSLILALLLAAPASAEVLERVVARVNGDIVTLSEFEARQVAAVQQARLSPDAVEGWLRQNNARILQEAIDDLLITQRGTELGIRPRPEYVQEILDGIKKDNNLETDEQFQQALRREGMSLGDLRRNVERSLVRRQVLARDLEAKAAVSTEEARAEYEAHKSEYVQPEKVHLQEIVVSGPDAAARAAELVQRARGGEDFSALARAQSSGASARNGGELGWLARGELSAELDQAAFALPAGAVSDPISTSQGLRVLKVVEKSPGKVVPFEQVQTELTNRLAGRKAQGQYDAYVAKLREGALVQVTVKEVPLQVSPTATGFAPGAATAPAPEAGAAPPVSSDDEFTVTGSAQPERVVPPGAEAAPAPGASPTPPPPAEDKPEDH